MYSHSFRTPNGEFFIRQKREDVEGVLPTFSPNTSRARAAIPAVVSIAFSYGLPISVFAKTSKPMQTALIPWRNTAMTLTILCRREEGCHFRSSGVHYWLITTWPYRQTTSLQVRRLPLQVTGGDGVLGARASPTQRRKRKLARELDRTKR